jgi:hypothetical protein
MTAVEKAIATGDLDALPGCMSDEWLADTTIAGSASHVRDELEKWREVGIREPIIVPSSAEGNQFKGFEEIFAVFDD